MNSNSAPNKGLVVLNHLDKKQYSLSMDIVGNFMKCGNPDLSVKRHLKSISSTENYPYLIKLSEKEAATASFYPKLCNSMILAVETVSIDTIIGCCRNINQIPEVCIFSSDRLLEVQFVQGSNHVDILTNNELDLIK